MNCTKDTNEIKKTSENEWEQILFNLILHAGNARCKAKEAACFAEENNFEKAQIAMQEASAEQVEAHKINAEIIRMEARGEQVPFSVLLMHAMDLLMLAWSEYDYTEQYIRVCQKIDSLEKR